MTTAASRDRILVTVGAQMPFPRLIDAVDDWQRDHPEVDVLAQIGDAHETPVHIDHVALLSPDDLKSEIRSATLVVAHAGMGTIITCLDLGTPLVIVPRHGDRRETRNDHQIATARHFASRPGIWVADDTDELVTLLDDRDRLRSATPTAPAISPSLLTRISEFIDA